MTPNKLKTALIGFGKISAGYASDVQMSKVFEYSTHVQVLKRHPDFALELVVDPSEEALKEAENRWAVPSTAKNVHDCDNLHTIDMLVLATPPEYRGDLISAFPNLKAVLVEKPLATDFNKANQFVLELKQRNLPCQVNLMRRADKLTRSLALGRLKDEIGEPQTVSVIYGNGLVNNGTHMLDLVRLLFGEIEYVQCMNIEDAFFEGPLADDVNVSFYLRLRSGLLASFQPLRFSNFRENGLVIWGSKGRLEYLHGGLTILKSGLAPNRLLQNEMELAFDQCQIINSTLGTAIYEIYSNLAMALRGECELYSPVQSALETAKVVDAVMQSFSAEGAKVRVDIES